jgi:hypothetical protein
MDINLTLIMQAVGFAAFIWFTAKFVWPPMMNAIETRRKEIADGLAAGEQGRQSLASSEKRVTEMLNEAKSKASEIVAQGEKFKSETMDRAKTEALPVDTGDEETSFGELGERDDELEGRARHEEPALRDQPHAGDAPRRRVAPRAPDVGAREDERALAPSPLDLRGLAELRARREQHAQARNAGDGPRRRSGALAPPGLDALEGALGGAPP